MFFGAGSVISALTLGEAEVDRPGLLLIGLTFGLVVAIAVYAFGTTSGAHINPAVTVALTAVRRFPVAEAGPYILAQLAGALGGALLLIAVYGSGAADMGGVGGTEVADGVSAVQAIVAEAVGTALLMTAIMALAVDKRAPSGFAGLMIGLSVTAAILATGPIAGAALNPARTFGPLLTTALFDGAPAWSDFPVYIVGPVLGALIAAFGYDLVARPKDAEDEGEPAQGTQGDIEGKRDGSGGSAAAERATQHR